MAQHRRSIPAKLREEVLWSGDCAYCGGIPVQVDHVLPLSRGGTDDRIPPAYTEHIGRQLLDGLERAA